MKHSIISLLIVLFICSTVHAQINVGGNTAPDSSAMLQISGNTKGFLPPRMSRDSMYLIAKPARGLLVFNTTDSLLFMRRDSGWVALAAGDQVWQKNGNAIYNNNTGFIGIGTNNPSTLLHVEGANPLTLLGVADGTTNTTDSVLTITNGLVRKIPLSSLAMVSNGISQANAPLVYSGGVISINQASTTDDGYLSASDYNIFNNKVSSIALTASPLYPTTSFAISSNGAASASLSLSPQVKNRVFAGPTTGGNVAPTFRALIGADLPVATASTIGAVSVAASSGLTVNAAGALSVTNPSAGGSVTSASVVTANGLAGTVANPTTTPAITLTTTVTGMVKGNGTALLAATSGTDYAPGTAANTTGIVKSTTGTGALTTATASDFPTLNQNTTGTASNITGVLNATSLPALTGDVTSTAGSASTTIANSAVTNAKMANMAANTFKANNTGSPAAPTDITGTQATAMLNTFNTVKGLVPGVVSNTTSFLRADGTFAVPPGTNTNAGTVTSVSVTTANGVSGTVATNTTTPAISLTLGAITPTSLAATGTVTGSNLSGTNTGDETQATIQSKLGTASATSSGYLTQTDWNAFNNKQSSITNLGDTSKYLKKVDSSVYTSLYQNSLKQNLVTLTTTGTGAATFNQSSGTLNIPTSATYYNTNTGSGNRLAIPNTNQIKSVFATAPLTADSTTNTNALTFGITQAGTSSNGYLSSADWNTFNNKATSSNTWSIIGNTGTNYATNFLGTADNASLRFRTNNTQRMIMDSLGNAAMGTDVFDATNPEKFLINAGNTSSVNGLVAKGTINNYFQMNIKNLSSGTNATSDIVATADNGSETSNYVDLGINGSGYTGSAIQTGVANDGYLISSGNDFYMVNSSANKNMLFLTGGTGVANERMRILANGRVGMGVQDPTAPFVVKDTMEIRRVGSLSQLLFTNTAGSGDFRIGGDGGDLFWQGGGSRNLQMGSYWTTILTGDRQTATYPGFISSSGGTGVLVLGQRDGSVPLGVQANSATQSSNLTEWRNSSGTVLSAVTKDGNFGIGLSNPSTKLHIVGTNPLTLNGVQTGANTDSILTIINGTVKKLSPSALAIPSSNAWGLTGNTNTLASNYFLGTTNTDPLIFKVNSQQAGRIDGVNTFLGTFAGNSNGTTANQNTGVGYHALFSNTSGTYNTALGYGSLQNNVTGSNNIGIGNNAGVANNSSNSIAMGTNSVVNYSNSIAVGTGAQANNTGAVGIGNNTYVNGLYGIAIGSGPNSPITQAFGNYSVAIGYNSYGGGANAIGIGTGTTSNGSNGIAIGNTASSGSNANAMAIGNAAAVTGTNSTAIGYNAVAATDNALVLGDKSNTSVSVAIGSENFSNGNREKLLVDAGTTNSVNVISGKGNINSYLQLNIQNKSTGTAASSDVVATADNGDETTNYIDMGINSSTNSANYFGGANDAYLYTLGQNMLIGTAAAGKSISFLTGGGTQSSNERMRIDGSGNVGIGTTSPSTKLHIVGTNPLTLTGVQTGTNTSADSLLTITGGLVRKLPLSTFASPANFWSTTGNAGTNPSTNFIGTTDAQAFVIKQNNTQAVRFETNSVTMGNGANVNNSTNSYAFGSNATVGFSKKNSFAIGNRSTVFSDSSYALGDSATVTFNATAALAIGNYAIANSTNAVSIGRSAVTGYNRTNPVAIGAYATVDGDNGLALGNSATVGSIVNSTALGALTSVTAANSTAIGYKASTTQANTVVIGDRSNTSLAVGIGSETFTFGNREKLLVDAGTGSFNVISGRGDLNNYLQLNIKNANAGNGASSDVVATADNGNETNNYIDMGINSSGNTADFFGAANDAYLYSQGQNLLIGTAAGSKSIAFLTGGGTQSTNERMRIDGSGKVGIGTNSPADKLSVVNSTGTLTSSFTSAQAADRTIVSVTNSTGGSVGLRAHGSSYSETLLGNSMTGASSLMAINAGNGLLAMGTFNTGDVVLGTSNAERMRITSNGYVGIGTNAPTAFLQLRAGNSGAGNAPLKFTTGTNLNTVENGAVEFDGTNYYATSGSTRYTLAKTLTNTATLDFPSTGAGSASTLTITVTGAADGDAVSLGVPNAAISGIAGVFSAYVSAANTVTVKFISAGGTADPASGTFRVSILKY